MRTKKVAFESARSAHIVTLQNEPNDIDRLKASYAAREGDWREELASLY